MKRGSHPVKIRKKDGDKVTSVEVGTAVFDIYDSTGEALDALGEAKVVELINAQVRTNELNKTRGENRPGGLTKTALRNKAINLLTPADFAKIAAASSEPGGSALAMENLISEKMAEVQANLPDDESDQD